MKGIFQNKNKVFRFGFSGTSEIMQEYQKITLEKIIKKIANKKHVEHHNGMCQNADEYCFDLVQKWIPYAQIVMHPPKNKSKVFNIKNTTNVTFRPDDEYLKRNLKIVAESDILVACPKSAGEQLKGSGTWATIRYARVANIPIIIVFPNGSIRKENLE